MKQYHIFHAIGSDKFSPVEQQPRSYAGTVYAESLDDAYMKSQNFNGIWNTADPFRSTSIGDVIVDGDTSYMVMPVGFVVIGEQYSLSDL